MDVHQPVIFILVITLGIILGLGVGANANMIILAFVPWATCIAMVVSAWGHSSARWLRKRSHIDVTGASRKAFDSSMNG